MSGQVIGTGQCREFIAGAYPAISHPDRITADAAWGTVGHEIVVGLVATTPESFLAPKDLAALFPGSHQAG